MMYHVCVTGSLEAVEFYQKAFNAEVICNYIDVTGTFVQHAELTLNGQSFLSLQDILDTEQKEAQPGSTMHFWITFDDEKSLLEAYDTLKEGAEVRGTPEPCEWCKMITDLTDKFGIRWLLNVF
jgi:uncharacterized glyoxalase superfamily protein PhnB